MRRAGVLPRRPTPSLLLSALTVSAQFHADRTRPPSRHAADVRYRQDVLLSRAQEGTSAAASFDPVPYWVAAQFASPRLTPDVATEVSRQVTNRIAGYNAASWQQALSVYTRMLMAGAAMPPSSVNRVLQSVASEDLATKCSLLEESCGSGASPIPIADIEVEHRTEANRHNLQGNLSRRSRVLLRATAESAGKDLAPSPMRRTALRRLKDVFRFHAGRRGGAVGRPRVPQAERREWQRLVSMSRRCESTGLSASAIRCHVALTRLIALYGSRVSNRGAVTIVLERAVAAAGAAPCPSSLPTAELLLWATRALTRLEQETAQEVGGPGNYREALTVAERLAAVSHRLKLATEALAQAAAQ